MAKQELELAQYETEMEKRKIDIEMQKERIAREMRFQVQLEEKEVDLLALEDYDSPSNKENSVVGCKEWVWPAILSWTSTTKTRTKSQMGCQLSAGD